MYYIVLRHTDADRSSVRVDKMRIETSREQYFPSTTRVKLCFTHCHIQTAIMQLG